VYGRPRSLVSHQMYVEPGCRAASSPIELYESDLFVCTIHYITLPSILDQSSSLLITPPASLTWYALDA